MSSSNQNRKRQRAMTGMNQNKGVKLLLMKKKTLPSYQAQNTELQAVTSELKAKIKKLEQSIEKSNEKLKKKKPGKVTETAKKAKKQRIKTKKKLAEAKRTLKKENVKHENSGAVKKFKKARTVLLKIAGPKETVYATRFCFIQKERLQFRRQRDLQFIEVQKGDGANLLASKFW